MTVAKLPDDEMTQEFLAILEEMPRDEKRELLAFIKSVIVNKNI